MIKKILPSISERDYEEMKRACSDMPASYEEWLKEQAMSKQHYRKLGFQILEVLIVPSELKNYCKAMRFSPGLTILSHFAIAKHIQNSR